MSAGKVDLSFIARKTAPFMGADVERSPFRALLKMSRLTNPNCL